MLRILPMARYCTAFFISSRSCSSSASSLSHRVAPSQTNTQLRVIAEALRSRPHVSESIAAKQPLFVFLEGATGAGKSTVTSRLQQMGYRVHHENFIDLCMRNPEFPAHSLVMQTKWIAELVAGLQRHASAYETDPTSVKHGVVFFDRSPLTPAIYAARDPSLDDACKSYLLQLSLQIFSCFRSTVLLCSADPYAVNLRRSHRLMQSPAPVTSVRLALGEADDVLQDDITNAYSVLHSFGAFDSVVDTSTTKTSVVGLMSTLGIELQFNSMEGSNIDDRTGAAGLCKLPSI